MARREREILEHAVRTIAEQAVKADELVDEAKAAGGGDHPVRVHAKMLRLELLKVKADLERELEDFVPKTARSAALTCIGCLGSACLPATGRTGSQRRTASLPSRNRTPLCASVRECPLTGAALPCRSQDVGQNVPGSER